MPDSDINIPPTPDKYSPLSLGELIDAVPPDCEWLVRSTSVAPSGPYFCHVHQISCIFYANKIVGGISCKAYSISPEEAFRGALRAYEKNINEE